jgi:ankyrin repeat protein
VNSSQTPLSAASDAHAAQVVQLLVVAANAPDLLPQDPIPEGQQAPPRQYRRDENGQVVYKVDLPLASGLLACVNRMHKDKACITPQCMHTAAILAEAMDSISKDAAASNRALSLACKSGYHQLVELLMKHKVGLKMACAPEADASPAGKTIRGRDSSTTETTKHPLIVACLSGHYGVVRALLSCEDVPVDVVLPSGKTPLYIACARGDADMARLLLSYRASLDRTICRKSVDSLWINYYASKTVV